MKRKSYRISKAGSIKNIKLIEEELALPGDEEITVEVKAIGLNFADLFAIHGLYSATPKGSFVPGLEFSGIILNKGKNVNDFQAGEKIMGAIRFGAYTTHLNIDRKYVIKLPEGWSFEDGSSFTVQSMTAYYSLVELGNIKNNFTVLIHSAAGGVGIYANRIAKKFNAYTIGTTGSESKKEFLIKEGYDKVIIRQKDFYKQLSQSLGERKLDLVLESVGGQIFKDSFSLLAPAGRIIIYGASQFMSQKNRPDYFKVFYKYLTRSKVDPLSLSNTNRSVMGFNLIYLWDRPDELRNMIETILKMNLQPPHIGKVFSFDKLIEALKYFQSGKTIGKVVVKL